MNAKKYFAAMVDCSRNAVMKVEEVEAFAKTLSSFGYNALLLYTEDTYEVNGEPYFGYQRGRYSKAELRDLDAFCASLGMELIPCIQTLGHLNQIFRWNNYAPLNDAGACLLVDDLRTYELLDKMIQSCRECFSSKRIHIGMDECFGLGEGKYRTLHGEHTPEELLARHLGKVNEICKKYAFTPMIWSDMVFEQNGHRCGRNVHLSPEEKAIVPENISLVYWDYSKQHQDDYRSRMECHKQLKNELWYAGGVWTWVGFSPKNGFALAQMKKALSCAKEENIENIIITMWGDNGKECSSWAALPSLFACKKYYDDEMDLAQIKADFRSLTGESFDAFLLMDKLNQVATTPEGIYNASKWATYNDPFLRLLDTRVLKGGAEDYRHLAHRLRIASKKSHYAYLFEEQAALADFLSFKYDLGVRTYTSYHQSRNAVRDLLPVYQKAIRKMETFYWAFRTMWLKENKGQGLEIFDIRLGGILLRLKDCKKRLEDYASGALEKIEELEEVPLDVNGDNGEKADLSRFVYSSWILNVSPNVVG